MKCSCTVKSIAPYLESIHKLGLHCLVAQYFLPVVIDFTFNLILLLIVVQMIYCYNNVRILYFYRSIMKQVLQILYLLLLGVMVSATSARRGGGKSCFSLYFNSHFFLRFYVLYSAI